LSTTSRRGPRSAVRVAGVASLVAVVVYLALAALLDLGVSARLDGQVDQQVASRLSAALTLSRSPGATPAAVVLAPATSSGHPGLGIYGAPVFLWQLGRDGTVLASGAGAPQLAEGAWRTRTGTSTVPMGGEPFEVQVVGDPLGFLVAGETLAELSHLRSVLEGLEAIAFPVVVAVVFLSALAIASRAVAPVEEARRRQLEFTADASHELRTPLSVLEAEVGLARAAPRDAAHYQEVLDRVGAESARLKRIVEDLLWLARADSQPPRPRDEPIDLGTIADGCADRFGPVARTRSITLSVDHPDPVRIDAPPEWVDRLAGVLVDNACKYAPEGGRVRILVGAAGGRAFLAVEDDGPGVAEADRARLFDRFRCATGQAGGHGLGLAIADSVVRSTGGRWRVGSSDMGGARMEVSWPKA
jgi:signal transduction histidine kinase